MRMDEGLDTGDMLAKCEVPLAEDETGGSLFEKLSSAGAELLVETLRKLEAGEAQPEKQPEESPTAYARMITKEDGQIDWNRDAVSLERLIRGLNPWPSAYTKLEGRTLKIWKAAVVSGVSPAGRVAGMEAEGPAPGTVTEAARDWFTVQTGDGALRLLEVQLEGRKRMDNGLFPAGMSAGSRHGARIKGG